MGSINITDLLGVYNVRDFGYVARATADNSGAIQRAVEAAHVGGGGAVWLPADVRTIGIAASIELYDDIELVIPAGVTLELLSGANCDMIANADQTNGNSRVRISGGGVIDGNRAAQTTGGNGLKLVKCDDARVQVMIQNCYTDGLVLTSCNRPVLDVVSNSNGRHGCYFAATIAPSGHVVALNNGQLVAASGLAFDAVAGQGSTDASLLVAATDTQGVKTQQYGVLELAASSCDRNIILGSLAGNVLGAASFVGGSSILIGGLMGGATVLDGGTTISTPTAAYDGGAAVASSTNTFDGGSAAA